MTTPLLLSVLVAAGSFQGVDGKGGGGGGRGSSSSGGKSSSSGSKSGSKSSSSSSSSGSKLGSSSSSSSSSGSRVIFVPAAGGAAAYCRDSVTSQTVSCPNNRTRNIIIGSVIGGIIGLILLIVLTIFIVVRCKTKPSWRRRPRFKRPTMDIFRRNRETTYTAVQNPGITAPPAVYDTKEKAFSTPAMSSEPPKYDFRASLADTKSETTSSSRASSETTVSGTANRNGVGAVNVEPVDSKVDHDAGPVTASKA